jgi:pimeloyl-ACP methyl ester carboxylesterase
MPHATIAGHALYYEWRGSLVSRNNAHAAEPRGSPIGSPGGSQESPRAPAPLTLVFLHDGLGAVGAWRDVPEHIADALGARALVFDRWGYGRSDPRPDFPFRFMEAEVEPFARLLAALGIERPCLVGHSDGGSIALLFASRYPAAVRAVVTEAAHVFVERETQAGIEALVALQRAGKTPGWLGRLHGERADALLSAWSGGWLPVEHARWDITAAMPAIRCPLLAIQGERDEFGTSAQVEAIRRGVSHAEAWMVPESGHTPHSFAQGEFERRATDFLRGQIG